ncbi:hypothetical protein L0Y59_04215 [Candidatus Uhrbacteria bacterium]|nr:hypothetical protein [Candidatus Uhrbacteria bacterium]
MKNLNVSHIVRLLVADADRVRRGRPGIAPELERCLDSLAPVRSPEDVFARQSAALWKARIGQRFGYRSLSEYRASLPTLRPAPEDVVARFPIPLLVEARIGLVQACRLAGLLYDGDDRTLVPQGKRVSRSPSAYWIRVQDGRQNRGRSARECRKRFGRDEIGLTAIEGVALYVQHPDILDRFFVDLPGSVHHRNRDSEAFLGEWDGIPGLYWAWNDHAHPECGSASRWSRRT